MELKDNINYVISHNILFRHGIKKKKEKNTSVETLTTQFHK